MRLTFLLLLVSSSAWALVPGDGVIVHFKDGSSLTGTLVELKSDEVTVDVGGTPKTWKMDKVSLLENSPEASPFAPPEPPALSMPPAPEVESPPDRSLPDVNVPAPSAPNGFAQGSPAGSKKRLKNEPIYVLPASVAAPQFTKEEQEAFLKKQAEERDARKHQITTPESDFQFDLQQALDREARGLSFEIPSH